jgi:two-component system phosphate regulon response regulator PhoB
MRTILIADDEEGIRALIATTLESPDCRLLEAEDGATALEAAHRELPDLIIMDWRMPHLSGPEVAERLRADALTAGIPIILLTGMALEADRRRGLAAGVLAYLVKPFSPLELLKIVQKVLNEKAHRDEHGTDIPAAGPVPLARTA